MYHASEQYPFGYNKIQYADGNKKRQDQKYGKIYPMVKVYYPAE